MAHIFASAIGGKAMMAFWYHFAILFEALFILTAVDAGTRAGRFMLLDRLLVDRPGVLQHRLLGFEYRRDALCVTAWGYFLYQGVTDPLGGVNTLWPLFGISNQMLAAVALTLCTVVIFRMKRERYAWVTVVPTVWLAPCTLTVGASRRARAHVAHEPVGQRLRRALLRTVAAPISEWLDRPENPGEPGCCLCPHPTPPIRAPGRLLRARATAHTRRATQGSG